VVVVDGVARAWRATADVEPVLTFMRQHRGL